MLLTRGLPVVIASLLVSSPGLAQGTGGDTADLVVAPAEGIDATDLATPLLPQVPAEGEGLAGHGSLTLQLGFFDLDDSGAGNPFLDESLTVIEPVIIFDYNFTDRFAMATKLSYDYVSSASIDRLANYPDQSGATGDNYFGAQLAPRYQLNELWNVGGRVSFATEYDYQSLGFGFTATREAPDKNSSVTGSVDVFLDEIDLIRWDGVEEGTDDRDSIAATLSWYQVMSPKMVGDIGITWAQQDGFLATPYNFVVIEDPLLPPNNDLENNARGFESPESLPDDRMRLALFGRVRRSLGEGKAFELGGRFYDDDWDITSFTIEPRYYQTFGEDLDVRFRYRYYTQTESKYFQETFTAVEEFQTQDSDLSDFDSHTLGVLFTWGVGKRHTWDFGFDYVFRSDDLDYFFGLVGYTWTF